MVASVTAEVKVQVDKMEVLAPTIVPLQNDIASLNARSAQLQQDIATMKSQAAANATDKASKDDTVANTTNDIKILKQSIEQKKAEIDPLPGAIEVGIPPPLPVHKCRRSPTHPRAQHLRVWEGGMHLFSL
jgi:predicted RNase H-like nuclease (RuvC/YqgF family)